MNSLVVLFGLQVMTGSYTAARNAAPIASWYYQCGDAVHLLFGTCFFSHWVAFSTIFVTTG